MKQFGKEALELGFKLGQSSCTSTTSVTKLYASRSTEESSHLSTSGQGRWKMRHVLSVYPEWQTQCSQT